MQKQAQWLRQVWVGHHNSIELNSIVFRAIFNCTQLRNEIMRVGIAHNIGVSAAEWRPSADCRFVLVAVVIPMQFKTVVVHDVTGVQPAFTHDFGISSVMCRCNVRKSPFPPVATKHLHFFVCLFVGLFSSARFHSRAAPCRVAFVFSLLCPRSKPLSCSCYVIT